MGLSASSVNFLRLTSRAHSIEWKEGMLSNQKLALARESQKISREYNDALSSKVLKWSSNSGISFTDITYNTLMKPGQMNNYSPFLITDKHDKIVLSGKEVEYAKYLESHGGYANCRNELLSKVTRLPANTIRELNIKNNNIANAQDDINYANIALEEWKKQNAKAQTAAELAKMIQDSCSDLKYNKTLSRYDCLSKLAGLKTQISELYKNHTLLDTSDLDEKLNKLLGNGTMDTGSIRGSIYNACGGAKSNETVPKFSFIDEAEDKVNISEMIEYIVRQIFGNSEKYDYYANKEGYGEMLNGIKDAKANYAQAQQDEPNIDAETLKIINFYDQLFKAIEEKGWVENDSVSDSNYLNQMLQNNMYYLTTLDVRVDVADIKDRCNCPNCDCCTITTTNYRTQTASNISNVFSVNDNDAREDALVDYEYKKGIINEKETRIDTQLAKLQTELSAIKQMMQTVKTHADENTQRTFSTRG